MRRAQHQEDDLIRRQGLDLHSDVPLPYLEAILGGTIQVATLQGQASLHVPPGDDGAIFPPLDLATEPAPLREPLRVAERSVCRAGKHLLADRRVRLRL